MEIQKKLCESADDSSNANERLHRQLKRIDDKIDHLIEVVRPMGGELFSAADLDPTISPDTEEEVE